MDIKRSIDILNATEGKTVRQIAEHLRVTMPWVKKMMKGNNPRHIEDIAEFYRIPVSEFIKVGEK